MKVDVSVIIVSYNSRKMLSGLLDSLKSSAKKKTIEVIIVNNQPSENLSFLKNHPLAPDLSLWSNNLGFSKGVNLALKKATGKYVFLINPDCKIVGDALSELVDFAENKNHLGAVVPRLINNNNTPQGSVFKFPNITNAIKKYFFGCKNCYGKYLPSNNIQKVDIAVMAAMLIPRSTINMVGNLDERFFLYYEDIEFCARLKKSKLPIYYYPKAKVKHTHGGSGNFTEHLNSPLLKSSKIYYGTTYSYLLNTVLWFGHKWQVIINRKKYKD